MPTPTDTTTSMDGAILTATDTADTEITSSIDVQDEPTATTYNIL